MCLLRMKTWEAEEKTIQEKKKSLSISVSIYIPWENELTLELFEF